MNKLVSLLMLSMFLSLVGCSGQDSPKNVSKKFWQAVKTNDMETAKSVSTWDTVDYLRYLQKNNLHPERFELGDEVISETEAKIPMTLFTTKMGESGVKVPGVTILVRTDQGWRVDVKRTLGSVIKKSVNNIFDQLNGLMQEGLKEFDKSFSKSMKDIGKALEEGAEELKKELDKSIVPPNNYNGSSPSSLPKGQRT